MTDTNPNHHPHRQRAKPTPQPLPNHALIDPRAPTPPFTLRDAPAAIVSDAHPGLVVFPAALDAATQRSLAQRCLLEFPNAPCTTNHTAHHGLLHNLWDAAQASTESATFLRKLRWACVGPAYDWTARVYQHDAPHLPLPEDLVNIACTFAAAAHAALGTTQHASGAPRYQPDAALINYYRPGDTLGGHRDDVEFDQRQPIVSISLGCSAVFLIGGETRDVPPHALLLRSGDVVVLTGLARRCFHGVPRVLDDGCDVVDGDRCVTVHVARKPHRLIGRWWSTCSMRVSTSASEQRNDPPTTHVVDVCYIVHDIV